MKIRPLSDKVLIKRFNEKDKSAGGIIIPESGRTKQDKGEVIAVGPGKVYEDKVSPLQVKVGDKVLFTNYAGVQLEDEGFDKLVIMHEADIISVLDY
jgi:chaperonin GroES